jgi:flavodoxin
MKKERNIMQNLKRLTALLATLTLLLTMSMTAYAAVEDTGFSDVAADAWYAEAVQYCRDHELMNGTGGNAFSPDDTMTRSMLAVVLYRIAGSPAVTGTDDFIDTADSAWYANAVLWASQQGLVGGYGNGLFGTNDPVSREQIATILWRYAGSPAAETGDDFADESSIAAYATTAVDWARINGIVNGKEGNCFDPKGDATRAQVATILMNYTETQQSEPSTDPDSTTNTDTKVLVAYFSATNNTRPLAEYVADAAGADLYEITPAVPYTSADLNYNDSSTRATVEQNDASARPAISGSVENMADYDVVFIGYPIWWGQAPRIISTFLESYDLSGKTIIPFCTSGSSGIGSSATNLHSLAPNANWLAGQRFSSGTSRDTMVNWVNSMELDIAA